MGNHTIVMEVVGGTDVIREKIEAFVKSVVDHWGSYSVLAVTMHHWGDAPEDLTPKK